MSEAPGAALVCERGHFLLVIRAANFAGLSDRDGFELAKAAWKIFGLACECPVCGSSNLRPAPCRVIINE